MVEVGKGDEGVEKEELDGFSVVVEEEMTPCEKLGEKTKR